MQMSSETKYRMYRRRSSVCDAVVVAAAVKYLENAYTI